MKTKAIRQVFQFSILLLLMVFTQSCETEIPPEDLTPPKFTFQIHGDDFYHVFDQDSDYDNITLRLNTGATYEFIFTAGDQGGLASATWGIADIWKTRITSRVQPPWSLYSGHNGIYVSVNWEGDSSNPVTGATVTGFFEVRDDGYETTTFSFHASDFGGEGAMRNLISESLRIVISNGPTGISRR